MPEYIRISDASGVTAIAEGDDFKAVVVVEAAVSPELRDQVIDRLRAAGCLYVMAWGKACGEWAAAAQRTNRPGGRELVATRHEAESLSDVFRFARDIASHPDATLGDARIVHLSNEDRGEEFLRRYRAG